MGSNDHDGGNMALPEDSLAFLPPHLHHRLSNSLSNALNLAEFLQSSPDDPAFHVSSLLFSLTKQLGQIISELHAKDEGPPPVLIAEPGI